MHLREILVASSVMVLNQDYKSTYIPGEHSVILFLCAPSCISLIPFGTVRGGVTSPLKSNFVGPALST